MLTVIDCRKVSLYLSSVQEPKPFASVTRCFMPCIKHEVSAHSNDTWLLFEVRPTNSPLSKLF